MNSLLLFLITPARPVIDHGEEIKLAQQLKGHLEIEDQTKHEGSSRPNCPEDTHSNCKRFVFFQEQYSL